MNTLELEKVEVIEPKNYAGNIVTLDGTRFKYPGQSFWVQPAITDDGQKILITNWKKWSRHIKVGDYVKILEPKFFVRCGYENTIARNEREFLKQHEVLFKDFCIKTGIGELTQEKVVRAIAYERLHKNKREGAVRKIYTHDHEDKRNFIAIVQSIKYVKTGKYSIAYHGGGSYYGEDYEGPYLYDEKTHRIMTLGFWGKTIEDADAGNVELNMIEDIHLEKQP